MPKEVLEADLAKEDYVDLLDDEFFHGLSRKYGVSDASFREQAQESWVHSGTTAAWL